MDEITDALTALIESQAQAVHDLVGEQREFHLPRLSKAMLVFAKTFPRQAVDAMAAAKDAWGDPLVDQESP